MIDPLTCRINVIGNDLYLNNIPTNQVLDRDLVNIENFLQANKERTFYRHSLGGFSATQLHQLFDCS